MFICEVTSDLLAFPIFVTKRENIESFPRRRESSHGTPLLWHSYGQYRSRPALSRHRTGNIGLRKIGALEQQRQSARLGQRVAEYIAKV